MTRNLLLSLVLVGMLAACSTGGDGHTIEAIGMNFVRSEVHVRAGQPVTLHVVNRDGYAHAFDVDEFDIHAPLPAKTTFDADTEAIVAYLRSLPPAEQTAKTGDKLSFLGAVLFGAGMFGTPEKGADTVAAPPEGVTAEYGKYVATFGECRGCHGPNATGTPASAMAAAVPNPRPLVGEVSQAQFVAMMRTGVKPDGQPFPEGMPWQVAAQMTDNDLAALYAYLTAPVQ